MSDSKITLLKKAIEEDIKYFEENKLLDYEFAVSYSSDKYPYRFGEEYFVGRTEYLNYFRKFQSYIRYIFDYLNIIYVEKNEVINDQRIEILKELLKKLLDTNASDNGNQFVTTYINYYNQNENLSIKFELEVYKEQFDGGGIKRKLVKPRKSLKPTKPTKSLKPTKPIKPKKPTKPTKPTKPVKPTKPTKPTKPVKSKIVRKTKKNIISLF